ncbi:26631_t:CDS:1, partial [Gigaspora margarita]
KYSKTNITRKLKELDPKKESEDDKVDDSNETRVDKENNSENNDNKELPRRGQIMLIKSR